MSRRHLSVRVSRSAHILDVTQFSLLGGETKNHVFGVTTNPYDRYCTPGGSSGGEGALLAMNGSPLGVGTDIGG